MASIVRPSLLRQTVRRASPAVRSAVLKDVARVSAFHASSRKNLLPPGPRMFPPWKGTIRYNANDYFQRLSREQVRLASQALPPSREFSFFILYYGYHLICVTESFIFAKSLFYISRSRSWLDMIHRTESWIHTSTSRVFSWDNFSWPQESSQPRWWISPKFQMYNLSIRNAKLYFKAQNAPENMYPGL